MSKHIYIGLAAMLLLCLAPMPYGYYMLVRFLAMVAFGAMALKFYQEQKHGLMWTAVILALLFQPFAKIALGRLVWNIVDVVVAIGLIVLFFVERNKVSPKQTVTWDNRQRKREDRDNCFAFSLEGLLAPHELMYVANEEDKELTEYLETYPEVLENVGQMIGFHIIYLPLLMKRLGDKEVLSYRAPYLTDVEIAGASVGNDFLLQFLDNPNDRKSLTSGFVRTDDVRRDGGRYIAVNRFYPLSSLDAEPLYEQLHGIGKQIAKEQYRLQHEQYLGSEVIYHGAHVIRGECIGDDGMSVPDADERFCSQIDGENTDDLMDEVRERILKLRQRGIAEHILEQLLHPDNRLSRLVVTKDYRIILPDYNNMEIKMEPLVKAVFFLFLNHPEGIMFKCLPDFRQELTQIYARLKPYGMNDRSLQSIEDVTNPLLNSINEKCARIRGAFVGQFDNHMARHYYIDGRRGEAKKIALPRDLVVWE